MPIIHRICRQCSTLFPFNAIPSRTPDRGSFCSTACLHAWLRLQHPPLLCLICQAPLRRSNGWRRDGKYCSKRCMRIGYVQAHIPKEESRFLANVQQCTHGNECLYCCWPWTKRTDLNGYGILFVSQWSDYGQKHQMKKSRYVKANRYAWEILNKQCMPSNMLACHWCHVPQCVNPMHIYPGTNKTNMQHSAKDGRLPRGETNNKHKLTEQICREIRQLASEGWPQRRLAKRYNVSRQAIRNVIHRTTWKHVT